MKRLPAAALPLILLALAGCGSSSSSSSSSSSTPAATSTPATSGASGAVVPIVMQNIAFNPAVTHARVGQTVKWTNMDSAPHNVTYVGGPKFTSSQTFANGGTFSLKLTKAGTIQYRCTIHPGMNATIVVAP
jgi:plastocyanin